MRFGGCQPEADFPSKSMRVRGSFIAAGVQIGPEGT